jgi:GTPase KRas protein
MFKAGQEDFSAVRDQYMRTGDGFLCVYSITYAVSFNEVQHLHDHILRVKDAEKVNKLL